jgi:hypothetical protein
LASTRPFLQLNYRASLQETTCHNGHISLNLSVSSAVIVGLSDHCRIEALGQINTAAFNYPPT